MNAELNRVILQARALALAAVLPILIAPATWADTQYVVTQDSQAACIGFGQTGFGLEIPDINFSGSLISGSGIIRESVAADVATFSAKFLDPIIGIAFDVELSMSGSAGCVVPAIASPEICETPPTYECFSNISGTMTGVSGTDNTHLGAVYSLSLQTNSVLIYGEGASIFHPGLGVRGDLTAQLTVPNANTLPTGPMDADLRFTIDTAKAVVSSADASVHGTWQGTLDCIGQVGQSTTLQILSNTSTPTTLQIQSGGAKLGADTYCVNIHATPTGAEGQLASPASNHLTSLNPQGYVKFDSATNTLKLRLLRSEGTLTNIDFCKGEFTRTSTQTNFTVDWGCGGIDEVSPFGCGLGDSTWTKDTDGDGRDDTFIDCEEARDIWCDTVTCGPGTICGAELTTNHHVGTCEENTPQI